MTEDDILSVLDHSNDGYYCSFVDLGHVYSYLIDCRLNVFVADDDRWAIAIERLGYNPRAGDISLNIHYYGNCLINLEHYNGRPTSYYSISPIENFYETIDVEFLDATAEFWLVRGQQLPLSRNRQDYAAAGVPLDADESDEIRAEEVGRLVVAQHRDLFRATDAELYKSIPADLKKILVLDEWFHKDYNLAISVTMNDEELRDIYEKNHSIGGVPEGMTLGDYAGLIRQQALLNDEWNRDMWENNRPGSYETFQQIAKVIVTKDPAVYKPTLVANTHWENWPDSGSL